MGRGAVVYANERRRQTPFHPPPTLTTPPLPFFVPAAGADSRLRFSESQTLGANLHTELN